MKISKNYILYAIGEIILVVIGILIALYINNQSEIHKEKKYEKILLEKFKEENLYNLKALEKEEEFREKLPKIYYDFINYLSYNEIKEINDSIEYFITNTIRGTTFSFSKTNLINYINSQKNYFPEINKEAIYLENLQNDLSLLTEKTLDIKIEDYYKYLNEDMDFNTGEVYSFKGFNSVRFRNNLNLIYSVETEISAIYLETLRQIRKLDTLLNTAIKED
jgi:hypothetical protein